MSVSIEPLKAIRLSQAQALKVGLRVCSSSDSEYLHNSFGFHPWACSRRRDWRGSLDPGTLDPSLEAVVH